MSIAEIHSIDMSNSLSEINRSKNNQDLNTNNLSTKNTKPDLRNLNPNLSAVWSICLNILGSELGEHSFQAYIDPLKPIPELCNQDTITLLAPSRFQIQLIERNYLDRIVEIARIASGQPTLEVKFKTSENSNHKEVEVESINEDEPNYPPTKLVFRKRANLNTETTDSYIEQSQPSNLNPKYTFQTFVVGTNNQFCNAAACRVAELPGESYNPLFIYGGVGLGKTHLLHSIGNAALSRNPAAKVLYISSEAFTNELIQALRNARMEEFKSRLRGIEVLLIDDIQFISGKERTQEEFFHTFNALYSAKRQIVITSDKIPSEIDGIEERLQTRFAWGLMADLQAPDFETRAAILRRKAHIDNFHLPEDVAHLIAENISSNVRELEGALTKLHAISSLQKVPINLETAKAALQPLLEPKKVSVTIDEIKKVVAQHFSLKVSDIISKRRTKNLSFPRHIAMYLCRKHTTASYPEIGQKFGGRDHSSVIHAASVVANKVSDETSVRSLVLEIEKKLFD